MPPILGSNPRAGPPSRASACAACTKSACPLGNEAWELGPGRQCQNTQEPHERPCALWPVPPVRKVLPRPCATTWGLPQRLPKRLALDDNRRKRQNRNPTIRFNHPKPTRNVRQDLHMVHLTGPTTCYVAANLVADTLAPCPFNINYLFNTIHLTQVQEVTGTSPNNGNIGRPV